MRAKRLGLLIGLLGLFAIVAATAMAVTQPSALGAALVKKEAVLKFSVTIGDPDFDLAAVGSPDSGLAAIGDPDFDLIAIVEAIRAGANIGSSDPSGFAVDSFFDIEYRIDYSTGGKTVDVEIHAVPNNPDMDPVAVINNVKIKLDALPHKKEYTGHVTLLK